MIPSLKNEIETFYDLSNARSRCDLENGPKKGVLDSFLKRHDLAGPAIFRGQTDIPFFPMYVMDLDVFFGLYGEPRNSIFHSWGFLRKNNFIRIFDREKEKDTKAVFISHQWLSKDHPDPTGEKLKVLYRTLKRLASGDGSFRPSPSMPSCLLEFFNGFRLKRKTGTEWKRFFERSVLWIDYQSIPQVGDDKIENNDVNLSARSVHATQQVESDVTGEDAKKDDREIDFAAVEKAAVRSTPSFVQKCDLLVALCPSVKSETMGYCGIRTWIERGWTLFERFCAAMADPSPPIILVQSSEKVPTIVNQWLVFKRRVGMGKFNCCEEKHELSNPKCSKYRLNMLMQHMIHAKVHSLFHGKIRDVDAGRFLLMFGNHIFTGMPCKKERENVNEISTLAELKKVLLWRPHDDERGKKSGWTLLKYAIIGRHVNLVEMILKKRKYAEEGVLCKRLWLSKMTNLHFALIGSGSEKLVDVLISNGALPKSSKVRDYSLLVRACVVLNPRPAVMLKHFFEAIGAHPHQFLNGGHCMGPFGQYTMSVCAGFAAKPAPCIQILVDTGSAKLDAIGMNGMNIFHWIMINMNATLDDLKHIVAIFRKRYSEEKFITYLNSCCPFRELSWKGVVTRMAIGCAMSVLYQSRMYKWTRKEVLISAFAIMASASPLIHGLLNDQTAKVSYLIELGADTSLKNRLGMDCAAAALALGCSKATRRLLEKGRHGRPGKDAGFA